MIKNIFMFVLFFLSSLFLILLMTWGIGLLNIASFNETQLKSLQVYSSFLIPIITAFIGYYIFKMNKKFEHTILLKTKVIDKRVEYYSEVADELNDIYTYLIRVGNWKVKSPKDIIDSKRNVSKIMHKSKPFWSKEVFTAYRNFILSVFSTNNGNREDAKIKAEIEKYGALREDEKKRFTNIKVEESEIKLKYSILEKAFSEDMGVM